MISDEALQTIIGWSPYWPKRHEAQIEILNCKSKHIVIFAGKGFGKSMVYAYLVLRKFLNGLLDIKEGRRRSLKIWIVAPTYELSRKVFNYVVDWLLIFDKEFFAPLISDRPFPQIKVAENIWIQCKSTEEPASLMGERLDMLMIDEAPYIKKSVWEHQLAATMALSDESECILIGTPRGKNWVYQQWLWAKEQGGAFQFPSEANPYLSAKRLADIKAKIPRDVWEQEYLAIPQETASSVFRNIRDIVDPHCLGEPEQGHSYVVGIDLAQVKDYTVAIVLDKYTHKERAHDRFSKIDYPLQIERLSSLIQKFRSAGPTTVIVELNNVGLAVADELRARGFNIEGFKTYGTVARDFAKLGSKEQLIKKLAVDIENKNLTISDWEVLLDELEVYGQEITAAGHIKYGAPEGYHDDAVMALALANWGLAGKTRYQKIKALQSKPIRRKTFQYF